MHHMQFDRRPLKKCRESRLFSTSKNQIGSKLESDWPDKTTHGANRWRGVRPQLHSAWNWLTDHFKIQVRVHLGQREGERWIQFSVLGGNCRRLSKQTNNQFPSSPSRMETSKLCLNVVQACEGICRGSLKSSTHFHTKKTLITK